MSIVDLSAAGRQPMCSHDGTVWLVYNGEIYNHHELRQELSSYPFRSRTDSEVVLAAYERWGDSCVDRFFGMFAFILWDERRCRAFAARDRFGVKPLYYHAAADGSLMASSEIVALQATGIGREPDEVAWSTYLTHGLLDHTERTFWGGIAALPPGHTLSWDRAGWRTSCWYDLSKRAPELDRRPVETVEKEYLDLLEDSVRLRLRADVPVGISLSGGVDSSLLLGLVDRVVDTTDAVTAFTFTTGDATYDETPWVRAMLMQTPYPLIECALKLQDVPRLAESIMAYEGEPFGGIPTLAYSQVFERAHDVGVRVMLDGQGIDEQWAGYDYYAAPEAVGTSSTLLQGTSSPVTRPELLDPQFRELAIPLDTPQPFSDALRNLQYRDIRFTKLPRALRFNDRISMRSSIELREPFLDHRLVELAFAQSPSRKVHDGQGKVLLRRIASELVPSSVRNAPKRPLQTPQREWLFGPLAPWAGEMVAEGRRAFEHWFSANAAPYGGSLTPAGPIDNTYWLWQWISLGLLSRTIDMAKANHYLF